jgi:hypothetical protein
MDTFGNNLRVRHLLCQPHAQSRPSAVANALVEPNWLSVGLQEAPKATPLIALPATFDAGDADHVKWLLDTIEHALADGTDRSS